MRNRPQKKNLGGVEQLLQSLMTRLDENDRRYSEALGGLNERLNDLSHRAQAVSSSQSDEAGVALDRLREQASSLAEQVGAADASHKAQQHQLSEPAGEASSFSGANDDLPRPDFGDQRLNENFAEVTEKLEHSLSTRDPAKDFDALSAQMDTLARRFETALDARNDIAALEKIESQLSTLTAGFTEAQQNYAKVDAIEGHLVTLLRWAETTGTPSQNSHDSDRLSAIEQALIDLSDSAREMDSRTVSTLEAMNEALHSLAAQAATPPPPAAPMQPALPGEIAQTPPQPAADEQNIAPDTRFAAPTEPQPAHTATSAPASPYENLGATIPDYQPPSQKVDAPAAEIPAPAANEVQSAPQNGADASYEADSDFIASARRAAAAAAAQQPSEAASEKTTRSKWNFTGEAAKKFTSTSSSNDKKTRPTLVVVAVILLIVSAGLLYSRLNSTTDAQSNVETPQAESSSDTPAPDGSKPEAAPAQPAGSGSGEANPPKSGQKHVPPGSLQIGRSPAAPAARPQVPAGPQPRQTANVQQPTAPAQPVSMPMPPGQPISTATLLASLPRESRKPAPPDLTMEIREPEPRATTKPSGAVAVPAGPALVPAVPAIPGANALPQPKRAALPAKPAAPSPGNTGAIDSAPANEVLNGLNTGREVMPPARIGPQSLRVAAARGNPIAQVEIGSRYAKGTGVPKDLKRAAEWYARAAAQAHAPAQYRLAAMHERGHGVKKDEGIARTWYRRAAEIGNVRAMHNLAVLYTRRSAGGPDFTSAKNWFHQAARHGLADSQFNLGILYESGLGTQKNTAEAYKWFTLAAQQGDDEARKRREAIRPKLPAKSLQAAEKAVRAWRKVPASEDANRTGPPRGGWQNASAAPRTTPGDAKSIARAQKLLNKLGYDAGIADGRLGPQTKAAIRKFEVRSGNTGTGTVTPDLLRQLEALAS